jgi:hypothetical protein
MPSATFNDAEQLRRIVHELAEALADSDIGLRGESRGLLTHHHSG